MIPVFSLSGASGTGKTVTLDLLREKGYWINNTSLTRKILDEFKMTLDEIVSDSNLRKVFQTAIKHEMSYRLILMQTSIGPQSHYPCVFLDRSHADLYGYATQWERNISDGTLGTNRWLLEYERDLVGHAKELRMTFVLPPGKFDHVDDGVRAKAETQQPVHEAILDFYLRHGIDYHLVESITPEDRAEEIIEVAKGFL